MGIEHVIGVAARIADLKAVLAARVGKAEYKENVEAIKKEIARLEALDKQL